jgi:hypothetical protein
LVRSPSLAAGWRRSRWLRASDIPATGGRDGRPRVVSTWMPSTTSAGGADRSWSAMRERASARSRRAARGRAPAVRGEFVRLAGEAASGAASRRISCDARALGLARERVPLNISQCQLGLQASHHFDRPPRDRSRGDDHGHSHAHPLMMSAGARARSEPRRAGRRRALPLRPGELSAVAAPANTAGTRPGGQRAAQCGGSRRLLLPSESSGLNLRSRCSSKPDAKGRSGECFAPCAGGRMTPQSTAGAAAIRPDQTRAEALMVMPDRESTP